jgi:hypothetical protein
MSRIDVPKKDWHPLKGITHIKGHQLKIEVHIFELVNYSTKSTLVRTQISWDLSLEPHKPWIYGKWHLLFIMLLI